MFLSDEDFRVVIGETALKVISQTSPDNLALAVNEAIEEISGYLRPAFDTQAIFAATGNDRNRLIVMYTADIALYHLIASQPQKFGSEVRKERYERAIKWLEGVQSGKIVPDLPTPDSDADGNPPFGTFFHSQRPLRHNW
jgi:phage gp36-like protein